MQLLIIGTSGFVGNAIYKYALNRKLDVVGTHRGENSHNNLVRFDLEKHHITDVLSKSFLNSTQNKAVLICAAFSQIDQCKLQNDKSYFINVIQTKKLISELNKHHFKILFPSTSCIYDGKYGYYDESSKISPINEYGIHKAIVEDYIQKNCEDFLIFRMDKIVSDENIEGNYFSDIFDKIQKNQEIFCIDQLFSPTYIKDIASFFLEGWKKSLSGVYNVCNSEFLHRYELVKQMMIKMQKEDLIKKIFVKPQEFFNFSDQRMACSYMNPGKLMLDLNVRFTPMSEIIDRFLLNSNWNGGSGVWNNVVPVVDCKQL